jgi:hypothetical protein
MAFKDLFQSLTLLLQETIITVNLLIIILWHGYDTNDYFFDISYIILLLPISRIFYLSFVTDNDCLDILIYLSKTIL